MGRWSTMPGGRRIALSPLGMGATLLMLALAAGEARAQVPPGALQQLDHVIGSRIETFAILDTQNGASGGTYASKVNDTDVAITRVTGRGDVGPKRPIGDSGILWAPVLEGGIGYATFDNHFDGGVLQGNESTVTTIAAFIGGGVRFTVWDDWSLAPTLGVIYAHSDNDFDAQNDLGRQVVQLAGSKGANDILNWSADTLTIVPGIEARYRHLFGTVQVTVRSLFKYFNTNPIERSTTALSFESSSEWWLNELDLEWRMPLYLWGRQLRTGAYVSRSEIFGGAEETFGSDYMYQAGGRFVIDIQGLLWHVEYVGIGAGYFWNDKFSGWSIGAEISFAF